MHIQKLINKLATGTFLSLIISASTLAVPLTTHALSMNTNYFASSSSQAACNALSSLDASQGCGSGKGESTVQKLITTIVDILSIIVGIVAVITIIVSGLRFITSGGDAQKVSGAKTALMYALIGLVVVALAQAIISFTITNTTSAVNG